MWAKKNSLKFVVLIIFLIFFCSFGFLFIKLREQEESLEHIFNRDFDNLNAQPKMQDIFNRNTNGYARGVYIAGDYAYVAVGDYGLAIIDISDPTNPGTPVYKDTSGEAQSVFVEGNYAFVADLGSGLAIIDISNPLSPGSIYYEPTTGFANDVYVSGDYAYVATGSSGLAVISISDPTNPGPTIYLDTPGNSNGIYVDGNYAYTSELSSFQANNGLRSYDISDPTNPTFADHRETFTYWVRSVYVAGDYVYVAAGPMDLAVIDISDPINLGQPKYANGPGAVCYDVYVSGDYAYFAVDTNGMAIIDISDPINPSSPIYVDTPGNARGVCVEGDYAYIGDGNNGLVIIKIGEIIDPEPPYYESITNANAVQVVGDYAYVAAAGLAVVDISDPTNPGPVYYESSAWYSSVYVSGNYAYLTDDMNNHFRVVDISDPTNPSFFAFDFLLPYVYDIFVEGDFAYVSYSDGLFIVNISDPSDPTPIRIKTLDHGLGVHIEGNYAYVAAGESGLAVVDISDPINPGSVYYEDISGWANDVYVEGDYAYIAADTFGLAIIDISNPTNPGAPVYRSTSGIANGVWIAGDHAYVADDSSGLAVIDISNPTNPGAPVYRSTSNAIGVCVEGDYAYIADWNNGLVIIKIMDPWYILEAPTLEPIPAGPYYDGLIDLNWNDVTGATKYYVFRGYSPITTLIGRTPRATVIESMYQDTVSSNTTYYYAVVAADDRGNSFLSNFRYVSVTIDNQAPEGFSIIYPMGWITNQTPTVIAKFNTDLSGVDISTVQYTYSTDGNLYPYNWVAVTAVYYDEECTNLAYDGRTGWIYAKIENVPFYIDSSTDNTIRFRASDMVGNQGTQATASVIQIDVTKPGSFSLYSPTNLVADQTPTVIAQFYTATSGVNISTVEYAYSTSGESAPTNWAPVDGVFRDYSCITSANNGDTGLLYAKVNDVPFNHDSQSLNTIRFRATDIAGNPSPEGTTVIIQVDTTGPILFSVYSPVNEVDDQTPTVIIKFFISESGIDVSTVEYAYSTSGESTPTNWMLVDGVYTNAECTNLAIDGTTGWLFVKINAVPFNQESLTQNTIRVRAKDMLGNQGTQESVTVIPIVKKGGPVIEMVILVSTLLIILGVSIGVITRPSIRKRLIIKSPKSIGKYTIKPIGAKITIEFTEKEEGEYTITFDPHTTTKSAKKFEKKINEKSLESVMNELREDIIAKIETGNKVKLLKRLKTIGSAFYSLFFPSEIQKALKSDKLKRIGTIELKMDSHLFIYPWELFYDEEEFLGLTYNIGRFIEDPDTQIPYPNIGDREEVKFLIIGDPTDNSLYAREEANDLNKSLKKIKNVNTTLLVGSKTASYSNVITKLKGNYDFIHFTGHGECFVEEPDESGIALKGGILKAHEIKDIYGDNPPILVFINACESGMEQQKYENRVSGLASSFLKNGINYIGSIWVIHDTVAYKTSRSFYNALLNGIPIGESLRNAKKLAYEHFKGKKLGWASYILFGDPNLTLAKIDDKKRR